MQNSMFLWDLATAHGALLNAKITSYAFGIANEAISAFRSNRLDPQSELYKEIKAHIDWYTEVTGKHE